MIEFRPVVSSEIAEIIVLWKACGLVLAWSDPVADAKRAIDGPHSTIIGAFASAHLIGSAMAGWDGHRAWIYQLGVEADFRRWGIGRKLIRECEGWIAQFDANKVQLMVRGEDAHAVKFCEAIGYEGGTHGVFYRQLSSPI